MNSVLIDRGSSLFLPGGIVHSLGKGLYFEVLSDGDLKITLQDTFAGRRLTLEDRLDKLVTGNADDFRRALEFIDFDNWGESLINLCCKPPIAIDAYKKRIVHTEHFEAEWIEIAPADRYTIRNVDDPRPRIVIAVVGSCVLDGESDSFVLEANAGSFDDFAEKHSCYGAITHYSASHLHFFNQSNQKFIALHVCEPRNP